MTSRTATAARLLPLVVAACLLAGCQTTVVQRSDYSRPMPPEPKPAPAVPADAPATEMAFIVSTKPLDTDGNGYPDLVRATVVLFASPHPTSVVREGTFQFALYPRGQAGQGGEPLGAWSFSPEEARTRIAVAQYGPCYLFELSLLDAVEGGDVLPLRRADLVARFEPVDGSRPVDSSGVRSIQVGRRGTRSAQR